MDLVKLNPFQRQMNVIGNIQDKLMIHQQLAPQKAEEIRKQTEKAEIERHARKIITIESDKNVKKTLSSSSSRTVPALRTMTMPSSSSRSSSTVRSNHSAAHASNSRTTLKTGNGNNNHNMNSNASASNMAAFNESLEQISSHSWSPPWMEESSLNSSFSFGPSNSNYSSSNSHSHSHSNSSLKSSKTIKKAISTSHSNSVARHDSINNNFLSFSPSSNSSLALIPSNSSSLQSLQACGNVNGIKDANVIGSNDHSIINKDATSDIINRKRKYNELVSKYSKIYSEYDKYEDQINARLSIFHQLRKDLDNASLSPNISDAAIEKITNRIKMEANKFFAEKENKWRIAESDHQRQELLNIKNQIENLNENL